MTDSPHSRYTRLPRLRVDGHVGLELRPVPRAPIPGSGRHIVQPGETLDLIARRFYGREDLWWRIADANPWKFPADLRTGDELVIPPLSVATRTARAGRDGPRGPRGGR